MSERVDVRKNAGARAMMTAVLAGCAILTGSVKRS